MDVKLEVKLSTDQCKDCEQGYTKEGFCAYPDHIQLCKLHAASPDLLAALKELVLRCDGDDGVKADGSNIQTMQAHAAIAKAEGKQPCLSGSDFSSAGGRAALATSSSL